jgi:hypothetical protein
VAAKILVREDCDGPFGVGDGSVRCRETIRSRQELSIRDGLIPGAGKLPGDPFGPLAVRLSVADEEVSFLKGRIHLALSA